MPTSMCVCCVCGCVFCEGIQKGEGGVHTGILGRTSITHSGGSLFGHTLAGKMMDRQECQELLVWPRARFSESALVHLGFNPLTRRR